MPTNRPPLTIKRILAWADAHQKRIGEWPNCKSGPVYKVVGENWGAINSALTKGYRGLRGGSSLGKLLARHRGVPNRSRGPRFTLKQILIWADAYHRQHGTWPILRDGPIPGAPGVNWRKIDNALRLGLRGLPRGSSLSQLLDQRRGVRNKKGALPLTYRKILQWADAHHKRIGEWPIATSGPVLGSRGETWSAINGALNMGTRGLPGGSSLARFLDERRRVRNRKNAPELSIEQILWWAEQHMKHMGNRPTVRSGPIAGTRGETWCTVGKALACGKRGLPKRTFLSRLLRDHFRRPDSGG